LKHTILFSRDRSLNKKFGTFAVAVPFIREPKTKNELLQCIQKFWIEEMTTEQCNMYIDHIYKVVPACILMKGAAPVDTIFFHKLLCHV
jgi:hypothetical protein